MINDQWATWVRIISICALWLAAVLFLTTSLMRKSQLDGPEWLIRAVLVAIFILVGYSSLDAIHAHRPAPVWVIPLAGLYAILDIASAWMLVRMIRRDHLFRRERRHVIRNHHRTVKGLS